MIIAGVIAAGTESEVALDRLSRHELAVGGQTRAVAVAGVTDAFAWFRRQQVQAVTTFAPSLDLAATPPINETAEPTLGLVRDYEISPSLWGRYEVRLTQPAEPYSDDNANGIYDDAEPYTDQNGNGKWDEARETRDISSERGIAGSGGVWLLKSHGFLYKRSRADLPLGVAPNDRIGYTTVATEIRRLTLNPPAAAAICALSGSDVLIGNRGRVTGGSGAGVAFDDGTGLPVFGSGSEVTGSPASTSQPSYRSTIESVFGVTLSELKSMSDVSTTDAATIGSPIGEFTLNVIDGDATFNAANPLRGTGIVVVLGNCTIESGSNSFFSGLLWVQNNLTVRAPSYLRGAFIANGDVDVRGVGGDYAEIMYDDGIINELLGMMGQYRLSKAIFATGEERGASTGSGN